MDYQIKIEETILGNYCYKLARLLFFFLQLKQIRTIFYYQIHYCMVKKISNYQQTEDTFMDNFTDNISHHLKTFTFLE